MADRRSFLACFAGLGLASAVFPRVPLARVEEEPTSQVNADMVRAAAAVAGVAFTDQQITKLVDRANKHLAEYKDLHRIELDNSVAPPFYFNPLVPGVRIDRVKRPFRASEPAHVTRPRALEDVAFWPVTQLAALVRSKQVRSLELAEMYLDRIKRHNPKLLCVVTATQDRALRQAREADREIAAGHYRGPLHGVPWGLKDLGAVKGYPTTWGAAPFKQRILDTDATIVSRLDRAGAVLIAKLATGELALDDIWFGGQTKNPWDLSMGSQGSSAGPGSATSAGLVGFSIGTETGGSIVEPSGICGVTGLRPTFGRVSRHGFMTLSWSLDKIGPMCRSVEDCALVLDAIHGPDDQDLSVVEVPFNWDANLDIRKLRVGYLKAAFSNTHQSAKVDANDQAALEKIRGLGINLVEVALPAEPALAISPLIGAIIYGEGNAALKDPVETHPDQLVRQDRVAGQNSLRLLPAAEYLNANRVRTLLMQQMAEIMSKVDVYVVPFDYADYTPNPVATMNTSLTNLTGHPCVVVPHGFNEKGNPTSLTFIGKLFGEAEMLALARAYQQATDWHLKHPKGLD
jgi:Asp-tRNA(Asn)/Glu-tRNA(Gln) amidotransferase A subunit family amidase